MIIVAINRMGRFVCVAGHSNCGRNGGRYVIITSQKSTRPSRFFSFVLKNMEMPVYEASVFMIVSVYLYLSG